MQAPSRIVPFAIRPTTVVCVDDDIQYLKSVSAYLKVLGISHLMFTSPEKAIKYLEKISKEQDWVKNWALDSDVEDAVMGSVLKKFRKKQSANLRRIVVRLGFYQKSQLTSVSLCAIQCSAIHAPSHLLAWPRRQVLIPQPSCVHN